MKKILNSNGFSALEVALVVIVMGLIGGSGYYVYSSQKDTDAKNNDSTQQDQTKAADTKEQTSDPYAQWQMASFELIDASFKYPKSLTMSHDLKPDADTNTGFETYTLKAKDDTTISLIAFHFLGGFTGDEPKSRIDDVVTGTVNANNREFSSIIYKNSNGVYDSAYVVDSSQTPYKAGEEKQIFLNGFSVKPKGSNTERSTLSITFSGPKYQTYATLKEIKAIDSYADIEKFLNSLNIPNPN